MSNPTVYTTAQGTRYLKEPGVVLLSKPSVDLSGMTDFLEDLGFSEYLNDPTELPSGTQLCKTAGQLCYMSFGEKRTKNDNAEKYFDHIISSGHLSVLEHANFSFLFYGVSRSLVMEWNRHRHVSPSQISQRYVSGSALRFVERPGFQEDEKLHGFFVDHIDRVAREYEDLSKIFLAKQKEGTTILTGESKSDSRKKRQQAARAVLTNDVEAPIIVTANARTFRHIIEMRASAPAEIEIRELAIKLFLCLSAVDPILFRDYVLEKLPDGTYIVNTKYKKS
jgi:thymidylate synthase (FAD)